MISSVLKLSETIQSVRQSIFFLISWNIPSTCRMGPKKVRRQVNEKCEGKSNKEFNLEAVSFRTYEASLFEALEESGHAEFMALIGLTEFLGLTWTHVHKALAMEFLKNYRKRISPRISLSSSVGQTKIALNKKLIASAFHLSTTGYKHKNNAHGKDGISALFDPVTARRNGYYIRDCKDPEYFERLEALNRLICLKPPGQLISAVLVDVVIRAAIQPVDWAGLLLISLMKELDRVTASLRQSPCTQVGVHIFLILSNLKIVTPHDLLAVESIPYVLLDGYSTASSPTSSLPASPRSSKPETRLAKILRFNTRGKKQLNTKSPPGARLPEILGLTEVGQKASSTKSPPAQRLAEILLVNEVHQEQSEVKPIPGERLSQILGLKDVFDTNAEYRKSPSEQSRPVSKTNDHRSLEARVRAYWTKVSKYLRCAME